LNDLGFGAVQLGDDGGRKRAVAAVGGDQSLAVWTERQAVRVRGYLYVVAKRSNQAAVGKNCLAGKINLDRTLNGRRPEFHISLPSTLKRKKQYVPRD
jgi:hypothetical protein